MSIMTLVLVQVPLQERLVAKHVIHGAGYACGDDVYAYAHACDDRHKTNENHHLEWLYRHWYQPKTLLERF